MSLLRLLHIHRATAWQFAAPWVEITQCRCGAWRLSWGSPSHPASLGSCWTDLETIKAVMAIHTPTPQEQ